MWLEHFLAHPLRNIDAYVVSLRLDHRLPAHEDNLWQVNAAQTFACSSCRVRRPARDRAGIGWHSAVDSFVGETPTVNYVHAFYPHLHMVWRESSGIPSVKRQLGLGLAGSAAAEQTEHASEENFFQRTLDIAFKRHAVARLNI